MICFMTEKGEKTEKTALEQLSKLVIEGINKIKSLTVEEFERTLSDFRRPWHHHATIR